MAAKALEHKFETAGELHPDDAVAVYRDIALGQHGNDADSVKIKEQAIQKLADLYASKKEAAALRSLLTELRPLFGVIPKAKTAKIVRTIIETISKVPGSTDLQVSEILLRMRAWFTSPYQAPDNVGELASSAEGILLHWACEYYSCHPKSFGECTWRYLRSQWSGTDLASGSENELMSCYRGSTSDNFPILGNAAGGM